ncbi:MAG: hypothetical protein SGJ10_00165, partial [Bacteroidota bacterium]|nr:hypothetical protein [Bacteroidota bacterium]
VMLRNEASAQKEGQALIDSLLVQLPKAKEDTNKVKMLNGISFNYYSINPRGYKIWQACTGTFRTNELGTLDCRIE